MHLDDIVERRDRFKNELIIAAHLSTRYHSKSVRSVAGEGAARYAGWADALVALEGTLRV